LGTARVLKIVGVVFLVLVGALLATEQTRVLGIVLPVAGLLAIAALVNPVFLVLAYVATRPLADAVVFVPVGGFRLGELWGAGLVVVLVAYGFTAGVRGRPSGSRWLIPLSFFFALALASLTRSAELTDAVSGLVKVGSWILLALTCEQIASTAAGQRLIARTGVAIAVLTLVVIGVAVVQNQYGAAYYAGGAAYDTVGQGPHGLASMAVMSSVFVWAGAMYSRRRLLYTGIAALLGAAIVLSLVRTTFLAFVLLALWFTWWSLRSRRPSVVVAALAALAGVAVAVYLLQGELLSRLSDLSSLTSGGSIGEAAGSGRIGIWTALFRSATSSAQTLLLGQGADASSQVALASVGDDFWAHNDFLEFLVTGGVGLAVLHLMTLVWLLSPGLSLSRDRRQSREVRDVARLLTVAGLAYMLMAFFNGMAFYLSASLVAAMFAGLALGLRRTPGASFLDVNTPSNSLDDEASRMLEEESVSTDE